MILFKKEINEFGINQTFVETKNILIRFWSGKHGGIKRFDFYISDRGIEIGFYVPSYQWFIRIETGTSVFGINSERGFYKYKN